MQEERDRWQADRNRLVAELEELQRSGMAPGVSSYQPSAVASAVAVASPSERCNRSPSPATKDRNLELSMIQVSVPMCGKNALASAL